VPVVSALRSFTDFVRPGVNGVVFDHTCPGAAGLLADALAGLIADPTRRGELARVARESVRQYDFPLMAGRLLEDFSTLLPAPDRQT